MGSAVIKELQVLFKYKKYFTYSAFVVLAGVVSFLSDAGGALENVKKLFGQDDPLVLVAARLSPFARDPKVIDGRDEATLSLLVRNYGKETVMLTNADLEIVHAKGAKIGKGGIFGRCVMSKVDNENTPLTISSGKSARLAISRTINLPGVSSFLSDEKLLPVFVHTIDGQPYSIAQSMYVDELNNFFSVNYGRDAALKVTLYSAPSGDKHVFVLPLTQGKDLFAKDGSLQHDWFIANWKAWDERAMALASSCDDIERHDW